MISSIQIKGMQSFKDCTLPLTEGINIIKGKNQTGKSVLFKIIYELCFPGYHNVRDLIREGENEGFILFTLEDGERIKVIFMRSERHFFAVDKDDNILLNEVGYQTPPYIIQRLGLVTSEGTEIVSNVLVKENGTVFVGTNKRLNAKLLQDLLEPKEAQELIDGIEAIFSKLSGSLVDLNNDVYWIENTIRKFPITDPNRLEEIESGTHNNHLVDNVPELIDGMEKLKSVLTVGELPENNLTTVREITKGLLQLSDIIKVGELPENNLTKIKNVINVLNQIKDVNEVAPEEQVSETDRLFEFMDLAKRIMSVKLLDIKESATSEQTDSIYYSKETFDAVKNCTEIITALIKGTKEFEEKLAMEKKAEKEINDFIQEFDICPFCEREMNNHETRNKESVACTRTTHMG